MGSNLEFGPWHRIAVWQVNTPDEHTINRCFVITGYENAQKDLLKKKQHGEKIVSVKGEKPSKVVNLMDALRKRHKRINHVPPREHRHVAPSPLMRRRLLALPPGERRASHENKNRPARTFGRRSSRTP